MNENVSEILTLTSPAGIASGFVTNGSVLATGVQYDVSSFFY